MSFGYCVRLAASALAILASISVVHSAEPVRLITPEEARLPAADPDDGNGRAVTRGPGIDAVAPSPVGVSGEWSSVPAPMRDAFDRVVARGAVRRFHR